MILHGWTHPRLIPTVIVSTLGALSAALSNPSGGTTILLAPGDYGDLSLSDKTYAAAVTIRSESVNGRAIFHRINLVNVQNLYIDNIEVDGTLRQGEPLWTKIVQITNCSNIEIANSDLHGSLDQEPKNDGFGIVTNSSSNVVIRNNHIHEFYRGALTYDSNNVAFIQNRVDTMASDGFDFSNAKNVLVEANTMTNFHPAAEDHPDCVQFWTDNALDVNRDIMIRDNVFYEGTGQPFQGIFMKDENGAKPYANVTITGNVVQNSIVHGIYVDHLPTNDLVITNNTILTKPGAAQTSSINLNNVTGAVNIANNVATAYNIPGGTQGTIANNVTTQYDDPLGANYYGALFLDALDARAPEDFLPVPGSIVDFGSGRGAQAVLGNLGKPLAYVQATVPVAGIDSYKVTFTALPYPGGGLVEGPSVSYVWSFDDGGSATGKTVTHGFATTALHRASVTVTDGGTSGTYDTTVSVKTPLLVDLAFDGALTNQGACGGTLSWTETPSYASGRLGSAASFAATGANFVKLSGAGPALSGMKQLTLAFDFQAASAPAYAYPVWLHTAYGVQFGPSNNIVFYLGTDTASLGSVMSVAAPGAFDGGWHRLLVTYDSIAGAGTMYLDNNPIKSSSTLSGRVVMAVNRDLTIGSDPWNERFNGQIDNLRIYAGIVPPDQEATIYAALTS